MKIRGSSRSWQVLLGGLGWLLLSVVACGADDRPPLTSGPPEPGRFVKQTAVEYAGTDVYHGLYLPPTWQAGRRGHYPVLVEYAPNQSPAHGTTGRVDDCRMGFYLGREMECIWLVLPYVDATRRQNQSTWWGDLTATVEYLRVNLPRVCEQFGGDPRRVVLLGFSRGAIACGYVGLHNDDASRLWRGCIAHSHFDGGRFTRDGAETRLARFAGRPVLITYGENDNGRADSHAQAELLRVKSWAAVSEIMIAGGGHSDAWVTESRPEQRQAVEWLREVLRVE